MTRNPAAAFWAAIAAAAVLFLGVSAVVGWSRAAQAASPVVATSVNESATVSVELSEFAIKPAALTAPAGVPLVFEVTNAGTIDHDVTITDLGSSGLIAAGETGRLETGPLEPGEYEVLCSVISHPEAGMRATLTVSADADAPSADMDAAVEAAGHGAHATPMTPEQMAELHDQGVLDFPAATEGKGNVALTPAVQADGSKEFRLVADEIRWEVEPGEVKEGMAYNGMIPGPRLDVNLGDRVRIILENRLEEPTALHSHGLLVPNEMDGVPGINQPAILPGESFTYEFEIRNSGTHMYHSHFNSAEQVPSGLLGAFVVHDPADPAVALDYTMVLNDGPLGFTINGKGFPATEPLVVKRGDTIRIRYMNEGLAIHPMHLHGIAQEVIAKDGYPLPQPYTADTIMVAPGERLDVLVRADEAGTWAFHCHILNHAEGPDGMFGMVTAMVVEE